jgi:hypothetical protein
MARGAAAPGDDNWQRGSKTDPRSVGAAQEHPLTLAEVGIDKHLADRARKFAARTDEKFETFLGKALQKVSEGIEGRAPIRWPWR